MTENSRKWIIRFLPVILTLLLFAIALIRGGFYFSSNDDSLLTDILCGSYSGTPDAHDIYHLYPVAAVIAFLYRVVPGVAWYGGILIVTQFVCAYLLLKRSMDFVKSLVGKVCIGITGSILIEGMLLGEFQLIQYTMTSAILGATAIFLLVTEKDRHPVPVIILYVYACLLRSQMGLLLLPFLITACFFRWLVGREKKKQFLYYFSVVAVILAFYLGAVLIHSVAYKSEDWQKFDQFNQTRTDIYDFGVIPAYDTYPDFYQSIDVSKEEQYLLETMNFSLYDGWDNTKLGEVDQFQKQISAYRYSSHYFYRAMLIVMKNYLWGIQSPYGILLYVLVLLFVALCIYHKRWFVLALSGIALGGSHMVCWVYLVWQNRMVERVTNGLYLGEVFLLLGMCILLMHSDCSGVFKENGYSKGLFGGINLICVILGGVLLWEKIPDVAQELKYTSESAKRTETVQQYCLADQERLYLLDTISFAPAKERISSFDRADNATLCGGWVVNSPLYYEKLEYFLEGDSLEQALPQNKLSFIVSEDKDITWLRNYLATREHRCKLVFREEIATETDEDYLVYDIIEQREDITGVMCKRCAQK